MRAASLAFTAAAALFSVSDAATVEEWRSRSIYQVMIDRFARTDGSTTAECNELYLFCNGTWAGLINNLDYIQGKSRNQNTSHIPIQRDGEEGDKEDMMANGG